MYELRWKILNMYLLSKNNLLGQGCQRLEHYRQTTDRQTDRYTHAQTVASENIIAGGKKMANDLT